MTERAQQIVGLKAFHLHAADAQSVQSGLYQRHLGCQFLGHGLALGLVALISLVPEGFGLEIEANADLVGRKVLPQLKKHIQKSIDGVGGRTVGSGQRPHAVKSPVHQTVAVNDHQMHRNSSFWSLYLIIIPRFA